MLFSYICQLLWNLLPPQLVLAHMGANLGCLCNLNGLQVHFFFFFGTSSNNNASEKQN